MKKNTTLQKRTFKILCAILCGLFLAASCEKPVEPKPNDPPNEEPSEYPKDVTFTDYFLDYYSNWDNLNYDNKVLIINSNEEAYQYIRFPGTLWPKIDFSKYSLILANGTVNSGIVRINVNNLQQIDTNDYQLNVIITTFESSASETWSKAILVEKLNKESKVELNITYGEHWPMGLELGLYKEIYPTSHGRHWINFKDKEQLEVKRGVLATTAPYIYEIIKGSIILVPFGAPARAETFYFHIINTTKFEIEFPELGENILLIYEKK
jgi:hypothetical protein